MMRLVKPGWSHTPFASTPGPGVVGVVQACVTVAATARIPAPPDHRSTVRRDTRPAPESRPIPSSMPPYMEVDGT